MEDKLTPEQWIEKRKRKNAQRKRDKAIKMLRDVGMTDAEIDAELGVSISPDESDDIIDAEVVSVDEPSKEEGIGDGPRHLQAVIPAQPTDSNGSTGRDWSKSPVPERRCRAHRKNGEQCKNAAIKGATVCRYHGGASRHVKMAARARLENATDVMAKALLGTAIDPDVSDAVKLSAIKDALDRGGLKAPNEVVLSPGQQSGYDEIFDDIATGSRADSRRRRGIEDNEDDSVGWIEREQVLPTESDSGAERFDTAPTAPAMPNHGAEPPDERRGHDGSDRPRATQRDERQRRDRQYPSVHITGEDAIRVANQVNAEIGALRALPPGRSGR